MKRLLAAISLSLGTSLHAEVIDFTTLPVGPITLAQLTAHFSSLGVTFDAYRPDTLSVVDLGGTRTLRVGTHTSGADLLVNFTSPIEAAAAVYPDSPDGCIYVALIAYGTNGSALTIQSSQTALTSSSGPEPTTLGVCKPAIRALQVELNGDPLYVSSISFTSAVAPPTVSCQMYAGIQIEGTVGCSYAVEYASKFPSTNWTALTTIVLPSSPYLYFDTTSPGSSKRFYRVVQTP